MCVLATASPTWVSRVPCGRRLGRNCASRNKGGYAPPRAFRRACVIAATMARSVRHNFGSPVFALGAPDSMHLSRREHDVLIGCGGGGKVAKKEASNFLVSAWA